MERHAETCRDIYENIEACMEYMGIQGNTGETGEYMGIQRNQTEYTGNRKQDNNDINV
jgi:hypothetical protein